MIGPDTNMKAISGFAQRQRYSGHSGAIGRSTSLHSSRRRGADQLISRGHAFPGNQAIQRRLQSCSIQAKLTVSQPADPFEREADRVADTVMRMQVPEAIAGSALANGSRLPAIQRLCSECEEEQNLQMKAAPGRTPTVSGQVNAQIGAPSGGQPLPESVRSFFEPRFGHDFGQVRVHTDAGAAASARGVHALAYTLGRDIVFGAGQYAPASTQGQRLLAHELAHVVQQSGGMASSRSLSNVPALQRQPEPLEPPGPPGPEPEVECKFDFIKRELECCAPVPGVGRVCAPDPITAKKKIEEALKKLGKTPPQPPSKPNCPGRETPLGTCCPIGEVWTGRKCEPFKLPTEFFCFPPDRRSPDGKVCCEKDKIWGILERRCIPRPQPPVQPPVQPPKPPVTPPTPVPAASEIFFNFNRPALGTTGAATLDKDLSSKGRSNFDDLVKSLKADPTLNVQLIGKASPEGEPEYNLDLGRRRAEMIAQSLEDNGIDRSRIADPPDAAAGPGCEQVDTGLVTCGETGAKGEKDRQVTATPFRKP